MFSLRYHFLSEETVGGKHMKDFEFPLCDRCDRDFVVSNDMFLIFTHKIIGQDGHQCSQIFVQIG